MSSACIVHGSPNTKASSQQRRKKDFSLVASFFRCGYPLYHHLRVPEIDGSKPIHSLLVNGQFNFGPDIMKEYANKPAPIVWKIWANRLQQTLIHTIFMADIDIITIKTSCSKQRKQHYVAKEEDEVIQTEEEIRQELIRYDQQSQNDLPWDRTIDNISPTCTRTLMTNFEVQDYLAITERDYEKLDASVHLTTETNVKQDLRHASTRLTKKMAAFLVFQRPTQSNGIGHFVAMVMRKNENNAVLLTLFDSLAPLGDVIFNRIEKDLTPIMIIDRVSHIHQGATLYCSFYSLFFVHKSAIAINEGRLDLQCEFKVSNYLVAQQIKELIPKIDMFTQ
jgi:hypothetical protein